MQISRIRPFVIFCSTNPLVRVNQTTLCLSGSDEGDTDIPLTY